MNDSKRHQSTEQASPNLKVSMHTILLLCLAFPSSLNANVVTHDNVIFEKTKEVSTAFSKWTITLVIDLHPYDLVLESLKNRSTEILTLTRLASSTLKGTMQQHLIEHDENPDVFALLEEEVKSLIRKTRSQKTRFQQYKTLHKRKESYQYKDDKQANYRHRSKRSLLPFVGSAINFLFGTVTENDMAVISNSVAQLENKQKAILHVVQSSITVLNTSLLQISENRQKINEVLKTMTQLNSILNKVTEATSKQIISLESKVNVQAKLNLIIREYQERLHDLIEQIQILDTQINMLALGRLTPSLITPEHLKTILIDIRTKLEPTQDVPNDPETELFKYYQYLTCTAIIHRNKILVIIPVPIVDYENTFDVYQIYNLPMPVIRKDETGAQRHMTIQYELESTAIAVNREHTRFTPLSSQELESCSKPIINFCRLHSPTYHVNLNNFCIISLFMKNPAKIENNCQPKVRLDTTLPQAKYMNEGRWALTNNNELAFSIACPHKESHTIISKPPVSIITLEERCTASNEHLILPAFSRSKSSPKSYQNLSNIEWKTKNLSIITKLNQALPKHKTITIPKALRNTKEVSLTHLAESLQYEQSTTATPTPTWIYVILSATLSVTTCTVAGIIFIWKQLKSKQNLETQTEGGKQTPFLPNDNPSLPSDNRSPSNDDPSLPNDYHSGNVSQVLANALDSSQS